jgi:hypothetical protein
MAPPNTPIFQLLRTLPIWTIQVPQGKIRLATVGGHGSRLTGFLPQRSALRDERDAENSVKVVKVSPSLHGDRVLVIIEVKLNGYPLPQPRNSCRHIWKAMVVKNRFCGLSVGSSSSWMLISGKQVQFAGLQAAGGVVQYSGMVDIEDEAVHKILRLRTGSCCLITTLDSGCKSRVGRCRRPLGKTNGKRWNIESSTT